MTWSGVTDWQAPAVPASDWAKEGPALDSPHYRAHLLLYHFPWGKESLGAKGHDNPEPCLLLDHVPHT